MIDKNQVTYIHKLTKIENHNFLQKPEFAIFRKRAQYMKKQLDQQEFRITIVGEFSAGKSTFLNALMGEDVLPHALRETTASVTYIRNVGPTHPLVNKMVIEFSDSTKKPITLDIDSNPEALKQYVTTMSKDFNVVEEIGAVHIYLNFPYTNEPIVFVDTPGLNGMAEGHYSLTLSEIQKAHASIFLFHIRGLSQTNIRLLNLLEQYQQKFIFVMNFIDELKSEEGESVEKKVKQLQKELEKAGVQPPFPLFGVSALKALVAKDTNLKRVYAHDEIDVDEMKRAQLMIDSQFTELEDYLWKDVILQEKEKIFKDSMDRSIQQLITDLVEELQELSKLNAAKIDQEDRLEVERRIERLTSRSVKNWQITEDYIGSRENDLVKIFREKVQQDLTMIREDFEIEIRKLTYQQLDLFKSKVENHEYQKELTQKIIELRNSYEGVLKDFLEEVYQGAILRIRKFHPTIVVQSNQKLNFQFAMKEAEFDSLDIVNQLKSIKQKEKKAVEDSRAFTVEKANSENELNKIKAESQNLVRKENESIQEKNRKISHLGSMPDVYRYDEKRYREVERAKWSPFRLFSETKTEKYTVRVTDDSEQRKWKANKEKIEREYNQQISDIQKKQEDYEEKQRRLSRNKVENSHKLDQVNRKLDEYAKEVQHLEKLRREIYEKNKREYFEIQKRDLLNLVRTHMDEIVLHEFEELLIQNIQSNIMKIKKSTQKYYIDSENKYRQKLQLLLQRANHDFDEKLERTIQNAIKEISSFFKEEVHV
ncbi:dynamin family protein [Pseudoneobacillus rhizosphaerae]|uniref:GTPase Der n=1 Tax=Pseudoneobacillus rhizosphaerae TaxID=2880968 RepID=A0A9C7G614_9BACI|nr:dynamin family protein [Pseudoneobacillus rhizosphaerae]CAG9606579.1 GTPase Der [Pseudoneobacillus rhizosphaerae]